MAGCGRGPASGRQPERPDDVRAYRRHEGIEPPPRSRAGQNDAQRLAVYGLAYLKELHEGRDPRFTGC
jgi:hypothetical protein